MSKIVMAAAFGAGYVLGAKAGRERYEQLSAKAQELWSHPKVQEQASKVQDQAGKMQEQAKDRLRKSKDGERALIDELDERALIDELDTDSTFADGTDSTLLDDPEGTRG